MNLILATDSYKFGHWQQFPPGTQRVYSYLESRGGKFPGTTFFGLQYLLKKYFTGNRITLGDVEAAKWFVEDHVGKGIFNEDGWTYIARKHHGILPLKIKAVPEGLTVPTSNVLLTIENTDPACAWLTNYFETLLMQLWYPITVATQSRELHLLIEAFLETTGTPGADFKLHDFGFRSTTSLESAAIGGAAHLAAGFKGSDNPPAILLAREYYGEKMAARNIPANEHSTVISWGKGNQRAAFENMLDKFPHGFVAIVGDSENIYEACTKILGTELKEKILQRDGITLIRTDSGELPRTLTTVLHILAERFGYSINKRGFKVLNPRIRVIQSDGVNYDSIKLMLQALERGNWSVDNVTFGMGTALLQDHNRDTQKFKFSTSFVDGGSDGQLWQREVSKCPVGAEWKTSKKGRLKLIDSNQGSFATVNERDPGTDILQTVFENGVLFKEATLTSIRERAK